MLSPKEHKKAKRQKKIFSLSTSMNKEVGDMVKSPLYFVSLLAFSTLLLVLIGFAAWTLLSLGKNPALDTFLAGVTGYIESMLGYHWIANTVIAVLSAACIVSCALAVAGMWMMHVGLRRAKGIKAAYTGTKLVFWGQFAQALLVGVSLVALGVLLVLRADLKRGIGDLLGYVIVEALALGIVALYFVLILRGIKAIQAYIFTGAAGNGISKLLAIFFFVIGSIFMVCVFYNVVPLVTGVAAVAFILAGILVCSISKRMEYIEGAADELTNGLSLTAVYNMVCTISTILLLAFQFSPAWSINGGSCSIQSYIWLPYTHEDVTAYMTILFGGSFALGKYVMMPIAVLAASVAGCYFFIKADEKITAVILPAVCGVVGLYGYLWHPMYQTAYLWQVQTVLCVIILLASACNISRSICKRYENSRKSSDS